MSAAHNDRNLLFGIVALQFEFVSRDQLVAGMNAWVLEKQRSLAEILVERHALSAARRAMLEPLVEEHLREHDDDPRRSLAALSSVDEAREALEAVKDTDVVASLALLKPGQRIPERAPTVIDHATVAPVESSSRFRILRQHAKGGLGVVFVAHDQEVNRQVALKEIQLSHAGNPESRSRFVLEAEITGGLEHPGIVPVYGLGHYPDGRPYYAMRFIKGDSLKEAANAFHQADVDNPRRDPTERNLALRQLLRRFIDVCNAIDYAHSKGILHRDLKPGNIMLGKYGETLVVDWGLAKPLGAKESPKETSTHLDEPPLIPSSESGVAGTRMGSILGTPAYMSPEQAAGRLDLLGPASDVYCLGATFYYLLTKSAPFTDLDDDTTLARVQKGHFPRPREIKPGIDPALEAICLKAMATKISDRYPTAAALRADLESWIADAPVSAWREPVSVRARRWLNRHRVMATSVVAVLIVSVVFLAVLSAVATAAKDKLARLNGDLEKLADDERHAKERLALLNKDLEKLADDERAAKERAEESRKDADAARAKAEAAEKRARNDAEISAAVRDFLTFDMLKLSSPFAQDDGSEGGKKVDPELKAADLLLRAAKRVEGRFADRPVVEREIRTSVGTMLRRLGRSKEAVPHLERATILHRSKNGVDHADTLSSMSNLAICYADAGRRDRALELFQSVAERAEKSQFQIENAHGMVMNLVSFYEQEDQFALAEPWRRKWLDHVKNRDGVNSQPYGSELSLLGNNLVHQGKWSDAETVLDEALKLLRQFPAAKWESARTEALLGVALAKQMKFAAAEPFLKSGYENLKKPAAIVPPLERSLIVLAAESLAPLYLSLGKKDEAEKWGIAAANERTRIIGKLVESIHDVNPSLKLEGQLLTFPSALVYQVRFKAGVEYVVEMTSPNFKMLDPYLEIRSANDKILARDDDSAGNFNARVEFKAPEDAVYFVRATSFNSGRGAFTLTVRAK